MNSEFHMQQRRFQKPPERRVRARGLQHLPPKNAFVGPLPSAGGVLKAPQQIQRFASLNLWAVLALTLVMGCAFDLSYIKQQPTAFMAVAAPAQAFILSREAKATMGTGFPTRLKAGTRWDQVGTTEQGVVFATKDQVVMVEASNMYEAQIVVTAGVLKGFYLPVEKSFVAISHPISLEIQNTNPNP